MRELLEHAQHDDAPTFAKVSVLTALRPRRVSFESLLHMRLQLASGQLTLCQYLNASVLIRNMCLTDATWLTLQNLMPLPMT